MTHMDSSVCGNDEISFTELTLFVAKTFLFIISDTRCLPHTPIAWHCEGDDNGRASRQRHAINVVAVRKSQLTRTERFTFAVVSVYNEVLRALRKHPSLALSHSLQTI